MKKMSITAQMIVKNEDRFIEFAIRSVLPFVDRFLIFDTGSTDKTVKIIKSFDSPKIVFEEKGPATAPQLVALRNEQIKRTDTDFFILVDGDEIWPNANLQKFLDELFSMPSKKTAAFCRTLNAVGDVYHYLPESAGGYQLGGTRGHLAMRAFRNVPGIKVEGAYPLETYTYQGKSLNDWKEKLQFIDTWYLHVTHLQRSTSNNKVLGFRSRKIETGLLLKKEELPEVFFEKLPPRRSIIFEIIARILTPLKKIKRKVNL